MKTLVIRLSSIGDILLTTPLLRSLRRVYPDMEIDFCVFKEYSELVENNPNISRVISIDRLSAIREGRTKIQSQEKYDYVIDLHNNFRSRVLRFGKGKKIFTVNKRSFRRWLLVKTKINLLQNTSDVIGRYFEAAHRLGVIDDKEGLDFTDALDLQKLGDLINNSDITDFLLHTEPEKMLVGVCPGAKHFTKRWLPERFAELVSTLIRKKNAQILLFGGKEDAERCTAIRAQALISLTLSKKTVAVSIEKSVIDLSGKLTLSEIAATMKQCDLLITNDTGLMHVASAQKKPLIALFGSTVKEFGFFPKVYFHIRVYTPE